MHFILGTILLLIVFYFPLVSRIFISLVLGACCAAMVWSIAAMIKDAPFDIVAIGWVCAAAALAWFVHLGKN